MLGAHVLDIWGCFAFHVEHQARTDRSPGASLACAPCRVIFFPKVWTSSELHVVASLLRLLTAYTGSGPGCFEG